MSDHALHAIRSRLLLLVPTSTRISNELGVTRHALDQRLSVHACYLPLLPSATSREAACLPLNDARRLGGAGGDGAASSRGKQEEKRHAEESAAPSKGAGLLMEAMRCWGVPPCQALAIGMDPRDSQAASEAGTLYIHAKYLFAMNPKDYIQYPGAYSQGKAPAPFDPALRPSHPEQGRKTRG